MTCPSSVLLSMYADGALGASDAAFVERHAATCAACSAHVAALRRENAALRVALRIQDEAPIPRFAPPPAAHHWLALVLGTALISGLSLSFWNGVASAVPSGLRWLNPLAAGELFERALRVVTFILYEGTDMWSSAVNFVGVATLVALSAWLAIAAARRHGAATLAASLLVVVLALPSMSHALEIRRGGLVTVAAGETIDDTLLAAGDTVTIDGNVNGDLLAFGRSVTVRGNVAGDLITGGETINVEGSIGGSIIGGARGLSLVRARVGRNLYGFGRDIDVDADAAVDGNAIAFGENIAIDGRVGTDLKGFASTVTVSGAVAGDVEGFASTVTLLPSARIGGNLLAHVDSVGDLRIASSAVVGGTTEERLVEREQRRNRYLTVGHYVGQIVRLAALFITGLLLLWAVPTLRNVTLPNPLAVLRSGGIGLAAAVTLPVAAVLVSLTIVGLPIGILAFIVGAVGLYVSKAVAGQLIGRAVFRGPDAAPHYAATLVTGLVIVFVAINLPLIGGLVNFVVTLVGFGVIVTLLIGRFTRSSLE